MRNGALALIAVFLTGFLPNSAYSQYLPTYDFDHPAPLIDTSHSPLHERTIFQHGFASALTPVQEQVKQFQVLIFPHRGTYTVPQGRDAKISSVRITTEKSCKKFSANLNSETGEWEKSGGALQAAKDYTLISSSPGPFFFECDANFTVHRAAPLKTYTYKGNFVSKVNGASVQIINIISPEEYLKGVVPAEVQPT